MCAMKLKWKTYTPNGFAVIIYLLQPKNGEHLKHLYPEHTVHDLESRNHVTNHFPFHSEFMGLQ